MTDNCHGLHPYGLCAPGTGCDAPALLVVHARVAELEAEVAALRAELVAADEAESERKVACPDPNCAASFVSRLSFEAERQLIEHHRQVHPHPLLDAVPPATGSAPAVAQGEDVERCASRIVVGGRQCVEHVGHDGVHRAGGSVWWNAAPRPAPAGDQGWVKS